MKRFKDFYTEAKKMKGPDPCWKGYEMIGKKMKGGKEVPNCVPTKEGLTYTGKNPHMLKALDMIDKEFNPEKRAQRLKDAETYRKDELKKAGIKKEEVEQVDEVVRKEGEKYVVRSHKGKNLGKYDTQAAAKKRLRQVEYFKSVKEEVITERGADSKGYYRSTESGAGLTRKGAKHFGIKTAVTTPPSKLKKGGTAWKRRKSFCARMSGMKGPMKDEKGRPTRKAMSLRRWNC